MTLQFSPGEIVSIIEPGYQGRVMEIKISIENRVLYCVRYWSEGQMYSADFFEQELTKLNNTPFNIGFTK